MRDEIIFSSFIPHPLIEEELKNEHIICGYSSPTPHSRGLSVCAWANIADGPHGVGLCLLLHPYFGPDHFFLQRR
jgi:hypothetical protein